MTKSNYIKGTWCLTSEQIEKLQDQGLEGKQIYVPTRTAKKREERLKSVGHLHDNQGLSLSQIADQLHISPRRVATLVKEFRKQSEGEK